MGVYLITGASRGLGAVVAKQLAQAGHSITLADLQRADLQRADLHGVRSIMFDVADEGQIASLMSGVEAVEGRLDGLLHHSAPDDEAAHVNTARLFHAAAPLLRAGAGMAIAMGAEEVPALTRDLSRRLGPNIRLSWLTATDAHAAAALLMANA